MIRKVLRWNWRIWLMIVLVLFSLYLIQPTPTDGLAVRSVLVGSDAFNAGLVSPDPSLSPLQWERILSVNGNFVQTEQEFFASIINQSFIFIETNKGSYNIERINISEPLGIDVVSTPTSNLRFGLDIVGGSRLVVQPIEDIDPDDFGLLVINLESRLNSFGLRDVRVTPVSSSLGGQHEFILIEIAGMDSQSIESIVTQQGRFEAKILNRTVFEGDQVFLTRDTLNRAGITECSAFNDGFRCGYSFPITLTPEAARSFADATRPLDIIGPHLSANIDFYLDGIQTNSLTIAASLRGQVQQQISITGGGEGTSQFLARESALSDMREMQAILESGNLPSALEIVKSDTISASLGSVFLQNALVVLLVAMISVSILVYIRYRELKIVIPMILVTLFEIILLLGFFAFIQRDIDLPTIAGIIFLIGTGFDHLIIITDELRRTATTTVKRQMKKGFTIILIAYATTNVAMLPLLFAGAGLLQGFAIATMAGLFIGTFITRPAYARMVMKSS